MRLPFLRGTINHVRVEQIANILEKVADGRGRCLSEDLRREANWLRKQVHSENRVVCEFTDSDLASDSVFYKGFIASAVLEKLKKAYGDAL